MSIHAERILGLQRMAVGTDGDRNGGDEISTVTLGSDVSLFNCCTDAY